ncbi:MAG: pilus assembly protein [Planctomycetaceae bacterium]|nr:pilus assembly protein [Planctomycetaceae bacterium]
MIRLQNSRKPKAHDRSGAAIVEFALVVPLLLVIVMGTIEASTMIYLKQTLHIAAYEAARTALVPKTTVSMVETTARRILDDRRVRDTTITVTPNNFPAAAVSTWITVRVDAPSNSNFAVPLLFFRNKTISGSCTMMKEY